MQGCSCPPRQAQKPHSRAKRRTAGPPRPRRPGSAGRATWRGAAGAAVCRSVSHGWGAAHHRAWRRRGSAAREDPRGRQFTGLPSWCRSLVSASGSLAGSLAAPGVGSRLDLLCAPRPPAAAGLGHHAVHHVRAARPEPDPCVHRELGHVLLALGPCAPGPAGAWPRPRVARTDAQWNVPTAHARLQHRGMETLGHQPVAGGHQAAAGGRSPTRPRWSISHTRRVAVNAAANRALQPPAPSS